jgi:hypothetical protein
MRAFVITVDALVALSFIIIAIVLISTQTFQPNAPRGIYLKQLTLDVLTVLEENMLFSQALEGNSSAMHNILQHTPDLACMQIEIYDSSGDSIATISKAGCGEYGRELQTAVKPFIHDGGRFTARAKAWYKKETP